VGAVKDAIGCSYAHCHGTAPPGEAGGGEKRKKSLRV